MSYNTVETNLKTSFSKRIQFYAIVLLCATMTFQACRKNSGDPTPPDDPSGLRVLGYLYSDNNWNADLQTDLSKLTDLNLAFVNPDENGSFNVNPDVTALITRAHARHVRVFLSIGGGDPPPYLADLVSPGKRAALVTGIMDVVDHFGFDGVDVDLEGDFINDDYPGVVSALSSAVKAKQKLLTAALATWNADLIHDSTLAQYDFINVMSYDATGPWDPANPGPHSPYEMAEQDAHYFIHTRGVPAEKVLIGLPFYGYAFSGSTAEAMIYRDIVAQYAGAENQDVIHAPGGVNIYYNGIPTVARKVKLAKSLGAAGVMIWELNQDTDDGKSLLKAINDNK